MKFAYDSTDKNIKFKIIRYGAKHDEQSRS